MFGGWAQIASPPEDLTEKERTPPPAPTQLDFPNYTPLNSSSPLTSASCQELFRLLCSIKKPQDITPEYVSALNLSVIPIATFEELLSHPINSDHNGSKPIPQQDRLHQIIREFRANHSDAFREVVRLPPLPSHPRLRLSHTRKFWTGLEKMSSYWDCSMDKYYEVPNTGEDSSSSSSDSDTLMSNTDPRLSDKPTKFSSSPTAKNTKQVYKGRRTGTGSTMPATHRDETASALVESVVWAFNCQVRAPNLPPRLSVRNLLFPVRQSYIVGRVPREKEMARRAVLEGPILGICSRVETNFHDSSMAEKAQGGGGSDIGSERKEVDGWKEILDLAREVAVMLLLAQERAREGKEEVKPGEAKWWTTTPRWGGGSGRPMENEILTESPPGEEDPSTPPPEKVTLDEVADEEPTTLREAKAMVQEMRKSTPAVAVRPKRKANADMDGAGHGSGASQQHKKGSKLTQAEKWRTLRPGPGIWDRKMRYLRIGGRSRSKSEVRPHSETELPTAEAFEEVKEEEEDDIFMVSAINHHVALLNMKVSALYLGWLAGEDEDDEQQQQQQQQEQAEKPGLRLKRTRWFDLFDEGDRVEFVQGLWGVMSWLTRE